MGREVHIHTHNAKRKPTYDDVTKYEGWTKREWEADASLAEGVVKRLERQLEAAKYDLKTVRDVIRSKF